MHTQLNRNTNLRSEDKSAGRKESGNTPYQFKDDRVEAHQLKKVREGAEASSSGTPIAQLQKNMLPVQFERNRTEVEEEDSGEPVQRVVDPSVPMNSRIRIDLEGASDFGDTGTIIRPSGVEKNCMAVEFDNERGVLYRVFLNEMSIIGGADSSAAASSVKRAFIDKRYPQLIFTINPAKTEEFGDPVYDVTGPGLENPTSIMRESDTSTVYYDTEDNEEWSPKIRGEAEMLIAGIASELEAIAAKNKGVNCHIVAGEMQDAFKRIRLKSEVLEIYADDGKDGNHIMVMGGRVRNHYVNVLNGKVYDSGTGAAGVPWGTYLAGLEAENDGRKLKSRKA